jgi:dimethylhistidine N-methyltransferase
MSNASELLIDSSSQKEVGAVEDFRADVLAGLRAEPKRLPSKYFYDDRGSQLFDQVCELEEYYLTRTEIQIMHDHAAEMAERIGRSATVIELGSGSSLKTGWLLTHLPRPAAYVPVDISPEHLIRSAARIADKFSDLEVHPLHADFSQPITLPTCQMSVDRRVVYFPGSTIGNFEPASAVALLKRIGGLVGRGGGLLIGYDLVKDREVLEAAYNDSAQITAEFNKNLLRRINDELDGRFPLDLFEHKAIYNASHARIEMYLVSQADQRIAIGDEEIEFAQGEWIRTELSHKFRLSSFAALAIQAGFAQQQVWTDSRQLFAVAYYTFTGE